MEALENEQNADLMYIDFAKAFDKKYDHGGRWIYFLIDRSQNVVVHEAISSSVSELTHASTHVTNPRLLLRHSPTPSGTITHAAPGHPCGSLEAIVSEHRRQTKQYCP